MRTTVALAVGVYAGYALCVLVLHLAGVSLTDQHLSVAGGVGLFTGLAVARFVWGRST